MRIAFVVHQYNRSFGHSRYVVELAERFRASHDVHVFTNQFDADRSEGITFHRVPAVRTTALTTVLSFLGACSLILGRGEKFDIVHAQGLVTSHANVITAHICNRAWFRAQRAVAGTPELRQRIFETVVTPLEHGLYRAARRAAVIAISQKLKDELQHLYQRRGPTEVIYHGVDSERFSPARRADARGAVRREWSLVDSDRVALFVGDLRKGARLALEALARVPGPKLVLVSRSDPSSLRRLAEHLGVSDRVRFQPATDQVERAYAAADLFVFPTPYDAFGMVISEAMASALPVITTRAAGASELIAHGESGWLLDDAADASSLAAALQRFIEDRALSERVGAVAREHASRWTWDEVARRTLGVYEHVLTGGPWSA
jgi:UDP-glucose:(heptosyl)LPS alpha-1,3-glucosyltransferase